ncbi:MAG: hypothetical protein VX453_03850, partial [Acidobacteriota bacterium]|nr:hypothetical protein [Acidobacteriota bacterium]
MTASSLTRRMLLRASVISLAGTIGAKLSGQGATDHPLPSYVADVDGDGRLTDADIQAMDQALLTSRGFELTPNTGFDFRAD